MSIYPSISLSIYIVGFASGFLQEGYEYVYEESGMQHVGTMDVKPSAAGLAYRSKTTFQVQFCFYKKYLV